jgi:hypothetical protein
MGGTGMDYFIIGFVYFFMFTFSVCLIPIGLLYGVDEFLNRKGIFWTGTPLTFLLVWILVKVFGFSNFMDPGIVTANPFNVTIYIVLAEILVCNTLVCLFILKIPCWYAIKILHKRPGIYKFRSLLAALISILVTQIGIFITPEFDPLVRKAGIVPPLFMSSDKPQLIVGLILLVLTAVGLFLEIRKPFNREGIFHDELKPPDPLPEPILAEEQTEPTIKNQTQVKL